MDRGMASPWVKTSTLPGQMLCAGLMLACAGCTTLSVEGPDQRLCSRYVNLFLEATPHARPPADANSKEWVNFGTAEAGQLELSNHDKDLAKKMLGVCEQDGAEALAKAKRSLKPWYKKIF